MLIKKTTLDAIENPDLGELQSAERSHTTGKVPQTKSVVLSSES